MLTSVIQRTAIGGLLSASRMDAENFSIPLDIEPTSILSYFLNYLLTQNLFTYLLT